MAAWFVAWRILGGRRVGIGVGFSNFEIGLGVGTGIVGADGDNFEIGTSDSVCWLAGGVVVHSIGWPSLSTLDDLANQSKGLRNRGLVIGLPGGAQRAFRLSQ